MVWKSQFKPRSLEYFRLIEESGETLIITDRGRPVLKVIPYTADPEDRLLTLLHFLYFGHEFQYPGVVR